MDQLVSNEKLALQQTAQIMRRIVEGTTGKTGADYFPALARHLAEALGFQSCVITECIHPEKGRVATLALWNGAQLLGRYEYELRKTPCQAVVDGQSVVYDCKLSHLFPEDLDLEDLGTESYAGVPMFGTDGEVIGHLAVLDHQPIDRDRSDLALLQMFAAQASAELERLQATRRLARSEERYRQFFQSDLSGAFILDASGAVLNCNSEFARIFGFDSAEDLLASSWAPEMAADDHEAFIRRLKQEKRFEGLERTYRRLDGTTVYTVENVIARFDTDGELKEIHGHVLDLTRQRRLERKLLHSQKLEIVGQLAGGIAHDFNNLLTSILGYGDLLLRQLPPDDPAQSSCQEIVAAARRAAELTRQLLAFSRRQIVQPRRLDLNKALRDTSQILQRLMRKTSTLDLQLTTEPTPIFIDSGQLEQITILLAVNAKEAMPDGGAVTIRTGQKTVAEGEIEGLPKGDFCWLEVQDEGMGITQDIQDKIFEPFFTTKDNSVGLGLSTVYGIVKQNAGTIQVTSKPDQGTTFTLYFPKAAATFAPDLPPRAPRRAPRQEMTILVAEDQDLVRQLVRQVLEAYGYKVIEAANAKEALERVAQTNALDLLITDVIMPGESGRDLAEKLLRQRPDTRVIYMSGHTDEILLRHGIRQGNLAFLQKPFSEKKLIGLVREVLD